MNWKNGRKLSDPEEFKDIKEMFFEPDYAEELSNLELKELESKRNKHKINQAR